MTAAHPSAWVRHTYDDDENKQLKRNRRAANALVARSMDSCESQSFIMVASCATVDTGPEPPNTHKFPLDVPTSSYFFPATIEGFQQASKRFRTEAWSIFAAHANKYFISWDEEDGAHFEGHILPKHHTPLLAYFSYRYLTMELHYRGRSEPHCVLYDIGYFVQEATRNTQFPLWDLNKPNPRMPNVGELGVAQLIAPLKEQLQILHDAVFNPNDGIAPHIVATRWNSNVKRLHNTVRVNHQPMEDESLDDEDDTRNRNFPGAVY